MKHPLRIREDVNKSFAESANKNLSVTSLKILVAGMGIVLIILALYIDNPLALAGILAWVLFP